LPPSRFRRAKGSSSGGRLGEIPHRRIESDWMLLYKDGNDLILARTGIHADLFR
jgi:mRNA-degrading endonuclease YafQ of YafQ-DinJ toxin-antitoxin module